MITLSVSHKRIPLNLLSAAVEGGGGGGEGPARQDVQSRQGTKEGVGGNAATAQGHAGGDRGRCRIGYARGASCTTTVSELSPEIS